MEDKNCHFFTFVLINFLVWSLQYTECLILYLFCQWKHEKPTPKCRRHLQNYSDFNSALQMPWMSNLTKSSKSAKFIWVFIVLGIYNFDQPSKPCLPGHVWPAGQARAAAAGGHKIGLLLYFFKRDSRATLSDCSWVLTIAHLMSWHKIYFHTLWNCKEAALTDDW